MRDTKDGWGPAEAQASAEDLEAKRAVADDKARDHNYQEQQARRAMLANPCLIPIDEARPVQFSGETPWEAIVHHMSLDMVEEDAFRAWFASRGLVPESLGLDELTDSYREWAASQGARQ